MLVESIKKSFIVNYVYAKQETYTHSTNNIKSDTESIESLDYIKSCFHAVVFPFFLLALTQSFFIALSYFVTASLLYKTKFSHTISAKLFFTIAKYFYSLGGVFILLYVLVSVI